MRQHIPCNKGQPILRLRIDTEQFAVLSGKYKPTLR